MAQVQGEEIYLAHSGQEVDDNIEEVVAARGSEASLSARLADIVGDFEADQQRQETEIGVVAALGAKNFLKVTGQTQTLNGVTFTVNSDQTVSLSGTATATTTFLVVDNATSNGIPNGNYVLTGCPSGGGSTTYDLRWYLYSSGKSAYDQGSGASVAKSGNTTSSNIAILIRSGVNTNGLVFRPMLRPAEITDSNYVPYAPANRELYEQVAAKMDTFPSDRRARDISAATEPGLYRFYGNGATTNLPSDITVTSPFGLLQVLAIDIYRVQILIHFASSNNPPDVYVRRSADSGSSWTSWNKLQGTSVASAQSAASLMQAGRIDAELTDVQEVTENDT